MWATERKRSETSTVHNLNPLSTRYGLACPAKAVVGWSGRYNSFYTQRSLPQRTCHKVRSYVRSSGCILLRTYTPLPYERTTRSIEFWDISKLILSLPVHHSWQKVWVVALQQINSGCKTRWLVQIAMTLPSLSFHTLRLHKDWRQICAAKT